MDVRYRILGCDVSNGRLCTKQDLPGRRFRSQRKERKYLELLPMKEEISGFDEENGTGRVIRLFKEQKEDRLYAQGGTKASCLPACLFQLALGLTLRNEHVLFRKTSCLV